MSCRWASRRSKSSTKRRRQARLAALAETDGWLLGPHDSAAYPEPFRSELNPSGTIRKHFDLYANVRPAKSFPGGSAVVAGTDLVIMRENTEGFYADRSTYRGTGEFMPTPDVAIALGIITRPACERIAREAFELASRRRKQVTIVHKANVLKMTTGLFRDVCREVARELPGRRRGRLPHRRHDRASRPARQRVRRAGHREHVRRHPVRPGR